VRRLTVLAVLLAALGLAPPAAAEIVTAEDRQGRTITFDVLTPGVDVEWYAELLRDAAHGDEIESLTVRIVAPADLQAVCGGPAHACYGGPRSAARITVPAGKSHSLAHSLLHEYGHHIDRYRGVAAAAREPNGSASWWAARGIGRLLATNRVSHTYSLGWERAIGEIYAEDYAQLHIEHEYRIQWLAPPTRAVRLALSRELENVPAAPIPAPAKAPLVIKRAGELSPGQEHRIPFELLGTGRRVTFTATVTRNTTGRMLLRCSDGRTASRNLRGETRTATIDLRNLGPARCTVSIRGTGGAAGGYNARLRLARESVPRP
jgi:hypothetical protein